LGNRLELTDSVLQSFNIAFGVKTIMVSSSNSYKVNRPVVISNSVDVMDGVTFRHRPIVGFLPQYNVLKNPTFMRARVFRAPCFNVSQFMLAPAFTIPSVMCAPFQFLGYDLITTGFTSETTSFYRRITVKASIWLVISSLLPYFLPIAFNPIAPTLIIASKSAFWTIYKSMTPWFGIFNEILTTLPTGICFLHVLMLVKLHLHVKAETDACITSGL